MPEIKLARRKLPRGASPSWKINLTPAEKCRGFDLIYTSRWRAR